MGFPRRNKTWEFLIKTILLVLLVITSPFASANDWSKGKWESIFSKDGIEIYSKTEDGSDLLAFKANGTINAPMEQIIAVLHDFDKAAEWNKHLEEKKTIHKTSQLEAVSYSLHSMPWPLKNRDMVLLNKLYLDLDKEVIYVTARSVEYKGQPEKEDVIRANLKYGVFKFKPIDDKKTHVELFAHIDPKGTLPSWVFNMIQQKYPYNYLKELEKHVNSRHFQLVKEIQEKADELRAHIAEKYQKRKLAQKQVTNTKKKEKKSFKLPYSR